MTLRKTPLVSILIPFYNCPFIHLAIESALNQTYPHVEIIVIDDGSTINAHLIDAYRSKIKCIKQENNGVSGALNTGLRNAAGEYIAWLSSDDLFDEHKINKQLEFMLTRNSVISFTNFNLINSENKITKSNVGYPFKDEWDVAKTMLVSNPINGCTVLMKKSVIGDVGWFDENLLYAQDYEYWIRCRLRYSIDYYHCTLTNYRVHNSMGSIVYKEKQMKEFHQVRSKYTNAINALINERNN
ncbi:glycosyltransferase [Fictibacillus nanhaiensis]|uniref:glycosyltransferase n=1 Tax=Fictibacillus nanhaiensis TaxID=742169 RepID=UPI001C93FA57|nr:glycosyltransferase [Fictibacillus nanhaiensis]MBY6036288.1 glycosyltransferase [Fictibacillus nanhaiensis]